METNAYFANVIVVDLVNNKNYIISTNVDARDAERIAVSINKEIKLTGNNNKVIVRVKLVDKVNTIQLYKNVVDKVLEVIDGNKIKVAVEDFDWDVYETNKEVKECIEEYKKEKKGELMRNKYLRKRKE